MENELISVPISESLSIETLDLKFSQVLNELGRTVIEFNEKYKPIATNLGSALLKIGTINMPMFEIQNGMKKFVSEMYEIQLKFSPIVEQAIINYQNIIMPGITDTISRVVKAYEPLAEFQKNLEKLDINSNVDIMSNFLNSVSEEIKANQIDFKQLKINDNGTIEYLDNTINLEATVEEINESLIENVSWEQKLISIFQRLKNKHPIICFIIFWMILSPFQEYYNDVVENIIANKINSSITTRSKNEIVIDRNLKTQVEIEVFNQIENRALAKNILNQYRFVKIDCLNVRRKDNMKSSILYSLKYGQVVRILYKKKNWTLIEYTNDDDSIYVKGWVNTRYISRFE